MKSYKVDNINDIGLVLEHVHDRYFIINEIAFNQDMHYLKIPLTVLGDEEITGKLFFLKKRKRNIYVAELVIFNVLNYEIIDKAQIGHADINTIDISNDILIIECGIPVTLKICVSKLYIELSITDKIADQVSYYFYPFSVKKLDPLSRI